MANHNPNKVSLHVGWLAFIFALMFGGGVALGFIFREHIQIPINFHNHPVVSKLEVVKDEKCKATIVMGEEYEIYVPCDEWKVGDLVSIANYQPESEPSDSTETTDHP